MESYILSQKKNACPLLVDEQLSADGVRRRGDIWPSASDSASFTEVLQYISDSPAKSCISFVDEAVISGLCFTSSLLSCAGLGLLCHRSAGSLCAAAPWWVRGWHCAGQLSEVWGASLLRRPPRCLLLREREPGPDDARQNGWSHQVRDSYGSESPKMVLFFFFFLV